MVNLINIERFVQYARSGDAEGLKEVIRDSPEIVLDARISPCQITMAYSVLLYQDGEMAEELYQTIKESKIFGKEHYLGIFKSLNKLKNKD